MNGAAGCVGDFDGGGWKGRKEAMRVRSWRTWGCGDTATVTLYAHHPQAGQRRPSSVNKLMRVGLDCNPGEGEGQNGEQGGNEVSKVCLPYGRSTLGESVSLRSSHPVGVSCQLRNKREKFKCGTALCGDWCWAPDPCQGGASRRGALSEGVASIFQV